MYDELWVEYKHFIKKNIQNYLLTSPQCVVCQSIHDLRTFFMLIKKVQIQIRSYLYLI